jgi:hypothetical protein
VVVLLLEDVIPVVLIAGNANHRMDALDLLPRNVMKKIESNVFKVVASILLIFMNHAVTRLAMILVYLCIMILKMQQLVGLVVLAWDSVPVSYFFFRK